MQRRLNFIAVLLTIATLLLIAAWTTAQTPVITGGTLTVTGGTAIIGATTGGSGAMPVMSAPGMGFWGIQGSINRASQGTTEAISSLANQVQCRSFYMAYTRTITQGAWYENVGGTATADIGLYNMAGQLVANLGGKSLSGVTNAVVTGPITQGSATIQGGQWYWQCALSTSVSMTAVSYVAVASIDTPENAGAPQEVIWPSGVTTGILPATMGTLTAATTQHLVMAYWW